MKTDTLWYKDAICYKLHVRAFADSNADGIEDFAGARQKLDYLQDLGITCIWLLPFYQSPLRDDGYDISDYYQVHPDYGTLADCGDFILGSSAGSTCFRLRQDKASPPEPVVLQATAVMMFVACGVAQPSSSM